MTNTNENEHTISLKYVDTKEQLADIFTKQLPTPQFTALRGERSVTDEEKMLRILSIPGIFRRIDELWFDDLTSADHGPDKQEDVPWLWYRLDTMLFRDTWDDMTGSRDYIPSQAEIDGEYTGIPPYEGTGNPLLYKSASGNYSDPYRERIHRIMRHVKAHNYTHPFAWQQEGDDSFFYYNFN